MFKLPHNCTHLTFLQSNVQNSPSEASTVHELWISRCWLFDSGSLAFSKTSLNIWKFTVHVLLTPGLENFEHYFISVWDECNCTVVWISLGIAFLWDWNENWPFPVLWPLLSFPNLLAYLVQHFQASSFRIWNSSTGIPSPPLDCISRIFWSKGKNDAIRADGTGRGESW